MSILGQTIAGRGPEWLCREMPDVAFSFADQLFQPLACGALFWPAQSLLLVADLHLEKGSAYAARGWFLPPHDSVETLGRLEKALEETGARKVAALGDSFHDKHGTVRLSGEARDKLASMIGAVEWLWITGNHDGESAGDMGGMVVVEARVEGIALRHEAQVSTPGPEISGHFHPKVSLPVRVGRRPSRPCFARFGDRLILPAYGAYTGGLSVDDPAIASALGGVPDALLFSTNGLIRLDPRQRRLAA